MLLCMCVLIRLYMRVLMLLHMCVLILRHTYVSAGAPVAEGVGGQTKVGMWIQGSVIGVLEQLDWQLTNKLKQRVYNKDGDAGGKKGKSGGGGAPPWPSPVCCAVLPTGREHRKLLVYVALSFWCMRP